MDGCVTFVLLSLSNRNGLNKVAQRVYTFPTLGRMLQMWPHSSKCPLAVRLAFSGYSPDLCVRMVSESPSVEIRSVL